MELNSICFSQAFEDFYYSERFSLCSVVNKAKECTDTIFTFRNFVDTSDEKRLIDNDLIIDRDIDKLLWGCKYIAAFVQTQKNRIDKFSVISYRLDNQNRIIASYFFCDRESKDGLEMVRFQIENKKIIGINVLPGIYESFIPIDEYEEMGRKGIDEHWNNHTSPH
jgi:hypothetical protein